jgi:hypothetical protein
MKKLFIVALVALMAGCKPWSAAKISVKKEPITPKLLTLEKKIEDVANATVITSGDQMKLFSKEVEENLTDPYGDKYGYIVMKQNMVKMKMGTGWAILQGFTAGIPLLFGVPAGGAKYEYEVELRVMDSQNRLVGKYSAIGNGSAKIAMYWGYSGANAWRKAYVDAINEAFNQIRPQIQADAGRLNDKLTAAGKLR